jgi:hypothetical protein
MAKCERVLQEEVLGTRQQRDDGERVRCVATRLLVVLQQILCLCISVPLNGFELLVLDLL